MLASHWVIEDLKKAAEEKNLKDLERLCKKYSKRYPKDPDLKDIYRDLREYLKSKKQTKMKSIRKRLKVLAEMRRLQSSGGTGLWFGDTRKKSEQEVR